MRERWKRIWARRPRLSRGQKTARNLLLCALILVWFWGLAGYPLPTPELELRRWERTNLLEPSRTVSVRENETLSLKEGFVVEPVHGFLVGLAEDWAVVGGRRNTGMYFYKISLEEAPAVTMLPGSVSIAGFVDGEPDVYTPMLALGVPAEAASGELTVRTNSNILLTGPGGALAEGVWLFALDTDASSWALAVGNGYTLKLFRGDGSLLLEQDGVLE